MSEKKAEEKLNEWSKEYVVPVKPGSRRSKTSQETIHRFYDLISEFYIALYRNRVYTDAFGLPDIKKIIIDPLDIQKFLGDYPIKEDGPSYREFHDFRAELIAKFGGKFKQFLDNFVLSSENLNVYPLFLKFDNIVLISQAYGEFFSYVLQAMLNKQLFNEETIKRSKEFESKIVKEEFEKLGCKKYFAKFTVKNKMEIDGIAIFNSIVYVIEVKGWGVRKLIEENTSKKILERDIRDAIEGYHFNFEKQRRERKGVSLTKKVEWVKDHKQRFSITSDNDIIGLLVIREQPTITEYNGCLVRFIDDLNIKKSSSN